MVGLAREKPAGVDKGLKLRAFVMPIRDRRWCLGLIPQAMTSPPLSLNTWPVTNRLASEDR